MSTPPPANPYVQPAAPMSPADEKLWATLIHIGGIFLYFIAPLIGYLVLKDRGPFIRQHTASALNFQLTLLIGWVAASILTFILVGFLLFIAIAVIAIVFPIIAAVAANRGEFYTYPLAIRFVS